MRKTLLLAFCVVLATGLGSAESPATSSMDRVGRAWIQVGPLQMASAEDPEILKRERDGVYAWLMAEQVDGGVERPLVVDVTPGELADLEQSECEGCTGEWKRLRVGVVKEVVETIADVSSGWGAATATPDGGRVWSAAIRSTGAAAIRVRFGDFRLPLNMELYLFNDSGDYVGPYVEDGPLGTGEFWSQAVHGDIAYLQLRRFGPEESGDRKVTAPVKLLGVGHVGSRFGSNWASTKTFCDYNASCIYNVSCIDVTGALPGGRTAVADARNAVAHILFVEGSSMYACSGGLINNMAEDRMPYFLTAHHCLSTDPVAATLEAYFNWTVECGAQCPEQWETPIGATSVLGAEVVETGVVGDYTLLRLTGETAPPGTTLLGWTSEPVAFSDGALLYRISHPAGAPQAYSEHQVDVDANTCLFWPRGSRIYSRDTVGATEGGSSGAPVVNEHGQVVGQLSGACGLFAFLPCLSGLHATVDGAFASYFDKVAPWLVPDPGCEDDADGDGFIAERCGGDDCNDANFLINPGVDEVCDNGFDDNCDLAVDDDDPECAQCLPAGTPCTRSADCCSGWCRWFGRTCR